MSRDKKRFENSLDFFEEFDRLIGDYDGLSKELEQWKDYHINNFIKFVNKLSKQHDFKQKLIDFLINEDDNS